MEPHCVIISARWSAKLKKASPGEYLSEGPHVGVGIECHGEHVVEYSISRTVKEAFREFPKGGRLEMMALLDELQKRPLTEWDLLNLRFLTRVANDLASQLLAGGTVREWCELMGMKPERGGWTLPQGRKLPRPLIIMIGPDEEYILSPQRFFMRRKARKLHESGGTRHEEATPA